MLFVCFRITHVHIHHNSILLFKSPPNPMNDLNLDSVSFDPRRYISHFLKTNTIKDLIKKNN